MNKEQIRQKINTAKAKGEVLTAEIANLTEEFKIAEEMPAGKEREEHIRTLRAKLAVLTEEIAKVNQEIKELGTTECNGQL